MELAWYEFLMYQLIIIQGFTVIVFLGFVIYFEINERLYTWDRLILYIIISPIWELLYVIYLVKKRKDK